MDRYNPQSIEKQAKKWPVLFFNNSLIEDFNIRLKQINGEEKLEWSFPIIKSDVFSSEYIEEYGIDVCRFAVLSSEGKQKPIDLLDSSYKQIAGMHDAIVYGKKKDFFDEKYWFRSIIQSYDHAIIRNKAALAVATINAAFKHSLSFFEIDNFHLSLVLTALYPFAPILSKYISIIKNVDIQSVDLLFNQSNYIGIKFKVLGGGWHKEVFDKDSFLEDPVGEFIKLKWVKKAVGNRNIKLNHAGGGIEIVFA